MLKIISVEQAEKDFSLNVIFNDGACGEIDFSKLIKEHSAFSVLKDQKDFISFSLEHGHILWDRDLDVSNSWIYENMFITREPSSKIDIDFLIHVLEIDKELFAKAMSVSIETLNGWIDGKITPNELQLKILNGLMNKPDFISELLK